MEQDKREKLKNDLAKNPELEAKFNLRMEGIVNSIKTNTKALTSEQFTNIAELWNNRESDYNSLHNEKRELLKHRGIYAPKYAFEFLDWFFDCYLFGKPMHVKEDEGLSLYHFRLYNEYVDRLFEHKNWTDDKERDFLNRQFNNGEDIPLIKEMNLDLLDDYIKIDMGDRSDKEILRLKLLETLKKDLRAKAGRYNATQVSALAYIVYACGILHESEKPKHFKAWNKIFCEIVGKKKNTMKPNDVKTTVEKFIKNDYKYLNNPVNPLFPLK